MVSLRGLAVLASFALAMGMGSRSWASFERYELSGGRLLGTGGLLQRMRQEELKDLLGNGPKRLEFTIGGKDLQKYYEAVGDLETLRKEGKRKNETDEEFAKRLKPTLEAAADAMKPVLEAISDQLSVEGADQLAANAQSTKLTAVFGKKVENKIEPLRIVVIELDVKDGQVEGFSIKVFSPKKK